MWKVHKGWKRMAWKLYGEKLKVMRHHHPMNVEKVFSRVSLHFMANIVSSLCSFKQNTLRENAKFPCINDAEKKQKDYFAAVSLCTLHPAHVVLTNALQMIRRNLSCLNFSSRKFKIALRLSWRRLRSTCIRDACRTWDGGYADSSDDDTPSCQRVVEVTFKAFRGWFRRVSYLSIKESLCINLKFS